MSYEKDVFAGLLTSASAATALATKQGVIQAQDEGVNLSAAGSIATINFVGANISASLTGGLLTVTAAGGGGGGESSESISAMIVAQLAPYITSNSVSIALATYVTSNSLSIALGTYITSNSVSIALSPYITSNSVSIALSAYITSNSVSIALGAYVTSSSLATALGGYITSNSLSAAVVTNALTVNNTASFSATAVFNGAVQFNATVSFSATAVFGGTAKFNSTVTFSAAARSLAAFDVSATISAGHIRVDSALFVSATASVGFLNIGGTSFVPSQYLTSNSASIALLTKQNAILIRDEGVDQSTTGAVSIINFVGTGISASLTGGLLTVTSAAGAGSGEGSVSISTMITTALAPYMTSNSVSLAVVTDTLTVRGAAAVSATLSAGSIRSTGGISSSATVSAGAVTILSKPVGAVLLGFTAMSNVTSFSFSGSWSDYCVLQLYAVFNISAGLGGTSVTQSAAIYTDGGTTAFLSLATVSSTLSNGRAQFVNLTVMGGDNRSMKTLDVETSKNGNLVTRAVTTTASTGFINAVKWFTSATISSGCAALYGWRSS